MKPLQGISPTGFWGFAGKPLTEQDVANLKSKGVVFEPHPNGDLMPDGVRLKYPRYRSDVTRKRLEGRAKSESGIKEYQRHRNEEYAALPDPKPDFFQWAWERDKQRIYDTLERIVLHPASSPTERTRAANTMAEFSQVKPKQQLEVTGEDVKELTGMAQEDLLKLYLERVIGIPWAKFQSFLKEAQEEQASLRA